MPHVMIDLETMSTAPNAAIMQIGACVFEFSSPIKSEIIKIDVALQSSLLAGGHVDPDTVKWWNSQRHELKRDFGWATVHIHDALTQFSEWFDQEQKRSPIEGVWSHGASFDIPVLESAYRSVGLPVPWDYRLVRDTRTVHWLAQNLGWEKPKREVAHTAVEDALAQCDELRGATTHLQVRVGR